MAHDPFPSPTRTGTCLAIQAAASQLQSMVLLARLSTLVVVNRLKPAVAAFVFFYPTYLNHRLMSGKSLY